VCVGVWVERVRVCVGVEGVGVRDPEGIRVQGVEEVVSCPVVCQVRWHWVLTAGSGDASAA
jgi:hypothetical protein